MRSVPLFTFFVLFCVTAVGQQAYSDSTWCDEVRTTELYRDGIAGEQPLLTMDAYGTGNQHLMLCFDILEEEPQDLRLRFIHCDRNWSADGLESYEFYNGFEELRVDDYRSSFTTLQPYIHYSVRFPDNYSQFTASGNYVVLVYNADTPDRILLTRRFRVDESLIRISLHMERATTAQSLSEGQEVSVTLEGVRQGAVGAEALMRTEYLHPWLQQNGRIDNMRELKEGSYVGGKIVYRWHPENVFDGGNTFRYFDISNLRSPIYNILKVECYGGETHVLIRPEEDRSRKAYTGDQVLLGGMKVNVWDRRDVQVEADYAQVLLTLPMDRPLLGGSIHVVGALTEWRLDEKSRMQWNAQFKTYTLRLLLKQGYYAYQLLYLPADSSQGQTSLLEGNHSETLNRYRLYLYCRQPGDRYDRLIGTY